MAEARTLGRLCRVWLPPEILCAGARLQEALEGEGGANLAHVRKKFADVKVAIAGEPSQAVPPERRMHLVARCKEPGALGGRI